jgi:hypothetical protein
MSISRHLRYVTISSVTLASVVGLGSGCLTRPVAGNSPTVKTNFTSRLKQQAVDKIDLVLAIDNSASMADKQAFLGQAVPNLVNRLVTPNCVDKAGTPNGKQATQFNKDETGQYGCPAGSKPEFSPIVDIHIGVVTSSMGAFGGDAPGCGLDNDDKGDLVARGKGTNPAEPSNFLAWYPPSDLHGVNPPPVSAYTDATKLGTTVGAFVTGAGEKGCGLEAQLESFYHFLIQPDPYASIEVVDRRAKYTGINQDLLKHRHDFLRPDSLVAIVMLTDEDDSSVDPLSIGGQGYNFMSTSFAGPRGTTACETAPDSAACTSCILTPAGPGCDANGGKLAPEDDSLNVRFFHMKQRFGIDPQYPIGRYVTGLTSRVVPDRNSEHRNGSYDLVGSNKCTNPLFAKRLPTGAREDADRIVALDEAGKPFVDDKNQPLSVCNLARGDRDPGLVFFAVIGGVPNELLHFVPTDADASRLNDDDWTKILGKDPKKYNYDGIDPRMIQSTKARPGRPGTGQPDAVGADPENKTHRDWDTGGTDLQYACTFALPTPKPYNASDANFDCKNKSDAPLCDGPPTASGRKQIRAKAFPTVREFQVVRDLGDQGIAASLCPQETGNPASPTYGYNPAVKAIVDRLANAISRQCLPQKLTKDDKGEVQCQMLEVLAKVRRWQRACDGRNSRELPKATSD